MKNKVPYTLIDTAGQTTAVIDMPIPRSEQPIITKPLMEKVKNIGQVCFIEKENKIFRLQMMGNELSINGISAGGFYLLKKLEKSKIIVSSSGLKNKIKIQGVGGKISVIFPKSIILSQTKNFVDFGGICYQFFPENNSNKITVKIKNLLKNLTKNRPAAGIVYYQKNKIRPLIFVKPTNTYVWETCCGSASIAYSMISNRKIIKQPSGKIINIKIFSEKITYQIETTVLS